MDRKELILSPEYITANIQIDLYNQLEVYMEQEGINRKQLAEHLGVSQGYVSQVLNGNFDHKLSKIVELSLAVGCVPRLSFIPTETYVEKDQHKQKVFYYHKIFQCTSTPNEYTNETDQQQLIA